jgi:CheY-like chemotaxis protein
MCHVLIIDDEPLIAMLIRDVLEDAGATSFSFAATQDEAVAAATDRLPAMISSDVKLLRGTGPRAVALIHAQFGAIPVMCVTGTPADCDPCPASARIIAKPFEQELVTRAFRDLAPWR